MGSQVRILGSQVRKLGSQVRILGAGGASVGEYWEQRKALFMQLKKNPSFMTQCFLAMYACTVCNVFMHVQWGQKVFSQPLIVHVLLHRIMREVCNFHHMYTSTMRDKMRKKIKEITL